MPFLFNRNSIREALKNHPGKVRRLLIRQGHEKLSEELIEEAKRQGVSYRVLPSEAFAKKCGSPRSHVCLEREDFDYTGQDTFLDRLGSMGPVFLGALDGVQDPQNRGISREAPPAWGSTPLSFPKTVPAS